ncbi:MAG: hypothetical protein KGI71_06290, partial [Patescibacteria group bacterium]|nr:hypothetical protein [Patescibacteria group bacterium]
DEVARIERKYVAVPDSSSQCYAHRFVIGVGEHVCVPIEWQNGFEFGDDFSVILPRRPVEPPPGGMKLLPFNGVLTQ